MLTGTDRSDAKCSISINHIRDRQLNKNWKLFKPQYPRTGAHTVCVCVCDCGLLLEALLNLSSVLIHATVWQWGEAAGPRLQAPGCRLHVQVGGSNPVPSTSLLNTLYLSLNDERLSFSLSTDECKTFRFGLETQEELNPGTHLYLWRKKKKD